MNDSTAIATWADDGTLLEVFRWVDEEQRLVGWVHSSTNICPIETQVGMILLATPLVLKLVGSPSTHVALHPGRRGSPVAGHPDRRCHPPRDRRVMVRECPLITLARSWTYPPSNAHLVMARHHLGDHGWHFRPTAGAEDVRLLVTAALAFHDSVAL